MSFSWEPFGRVRGRDEPPPAGSSSKSGTEPAPAPSASPPREPRHRLAVIACMDARVDPLGILGLTLGDANVLRNAGATVSEDVLRSLHAAETKLGVRRAILIGHTDCAGHGSDAAAAAAMVDGARRILSAMPDGFAVDAFMYDVRTGSLDPV